MACNDCNDRNSLPNLVACAPGKFFKARLIPGCCGDVMIPNTSPGGCPPQEPVIFDMRFFQNGVEVQTVSAIASHLDPGYPSQVEVRVEESGTSLTLALLQSSITFPVTGPVQLTSLSWSLGIGSAAQVAGDAETLLVSVYDTVGLAAHSVPSALRTMNILYV